MHRHTLHRHQSMIAADELQSLVATAHLLRSPKNAQRLLAALVRAHDGAVAPITLSALQERVGLDS